MYAVYINLVIVPALAQAASAALTSEILQEWAIPEFVADMVDPVGLFRV
jgi:hypothetical protein